MRNTRLLRVRATRAGAEAEVWWYRDGLAPDSTVRVWARRGRRLSATDARWLLARLDSLNSDSLSVARNGHGWVDAGELYVESRRGAVYRTVNVNAPRMRNTPEALRAARIAGLIDSVTHVGKS